MSNADQMAAGNNMGNSTTAGGALTPAEAAKECESGNGTPIKIHYHLGY